jgi:hypothetical protein
MTLAGGKRKVNKSLKSWVAFVKRVQKEEKLNYKDAIHRAKVRKDKGEKWMMNGGDGEEVIEEAEVDETDMAGGKGNMTTGGKTVPSGKTFGGGKRRTRSRRGGKSMKRKGGKTKRRSRRH